MVDAVTLGALRRLAQPTFQNIALAQSKSGNLSLFYESVTDNITAHAGGGQTSAVALVTEINRITTVATTGDSIKLPPTIISPSTGAAYVQGSVIGGIGATVLVINHGANPMQVFGSGTDTIDDVATATGVSQMQGSMVLYTCTSTGKWYSEGLATGYAGSLQTFSAQNLLVTATANSQTAVAGIASLSLGYMLTRAFQTINLSDSVNAVGLPASAAGLDLLLENANTGSINVYTGSTLDVINSLATTAPFAVGSSKSAQFFCTNTGQWHVLLSA
jgi:hypothetical protein